LTPEIIYLKIFKPFVMKLRTSFALTTLGLASVLALSNCKKETPANTFHESNETARGITRFSGDRIDAIVNGLAAEDYSFSFDQTYESAGITRTAYGADSYLGYVDPQDVICPEPFRLKQKKIAIWKRPNFIIPTCPDMAIDIWKLEQVRDLARKADPRQFEALTAIKSLDGKGGFLATEKFTSQFKTMSLDKIDEITKDLDGEKYLLLNAPGDYRGGATRSFYGYANLNEWVFRPLRTNLKDILKPTLKGCFDPIILSIIKERLQKIDPVVYENLNVTNLDQNVGVLSY
jgi:hypothetical protein